MCTLEASGLLEIHLKTSCNEASVQSAAIESAFLLHRFEDVIMNIFDLVDMQTPHVRRFLSVLSACFVVMVLCGTSPKSRLKIVLARPGCVSL